MNQRAVRQLKRNKKSGARARSRVGIVALPLSAETLPYAIKPNLFELESAFDVKLQSPKEVVEFCRGKIGCDIVCVSMGAEGAVLVTPKQAYFCPAFNIDARGVQGAGDSMVAGLIYAIVENLHPQDMLRYAMAAAAASVIRDGTEMCCREDFDVFLEKCPDPLVL